MIGDFLSLLRTTPNGRLCMVCGYFHIGTCRPATSPCTHSK